MQSVSTLDALCIYNNWVNLFLVSLIKSIIIYLLSSSGLQVDSLYFYISWIFDFRLDLVACFGQEIITGLQGWISSLSSAFYHRKSVSWETLGSRRRRDTRIKSGFYSQPGSKLSQTQFRLVRHLFSCWCVCERNVYCCHFWDLWWEIVTEHEKNSNINITCSHHTK